MLKLSPEIKMTLVLLGYKSIITQYSLDGLDHITPTYVDLFTRKYINPKGDSIIFLNGKFTGHVYISKSVRIIPISKLIDILTKS